MNYEVGCVYWFEPSGQRPGEPVMVVRVGRRWIHVDNGLRVPVGSVIVDGGKGPSPGRIWLSKEEADAHKQLACQWTSYRILVSQHDRLPEGLTVDDIALMRRLVGGRQR